VPDINLRVTQDTWSKSQSIIQWRNDLVIPHMLATLFIGFIILEVRRILLMCPKCDVSNEPPETLQSLHSSKWHRPVILSVPSSQIMRFSMTNIKISHWIFFRVIIAVQFKDHRKHACALCDEMHSFQCIAGSIYCAHFGFSQRCIRVSRPSGLWRCVVE
jgi:hypothetical protein